MKRILPILLILITALYVLPASAGFIADTETCKYIDKSVDDGQDAKKDNGKEFIATAFITHRFKISKVASALLPLLQTLPVHFTVDTPPPDRA